MLSKNIKELSLTDILNQVTRKTIRWCTPSLIPSASKIIDPYSSDISISYHALGYPSDPSGIFLRVYEEAAKAYSSDFTLFSVNGTSGSNFIVLRALSKQIPNARILAQRNIHQSFLAACEDYNLELKFLPAHIDKNLLIFKPNSINEYLKFLEKYNPDVLFLTNPTYEGLCLDLRTLVQKVREVKPNIIIFVDEAWGAHLNFSDGLPTSAMEAGVDICTQSTHKQGGALQQTSMIHVKGHRINKQILLNSYRHLYTTSPSFILLASMDSARLELQKRGKILIGNVLDLSMVELTDLKTRDSGVFDKDQTKIIVDVSQTGLSGYRVAKELEEKYGIIVESRNFNMILFLVPFQSNLIDAQITLDALKEIISNAKMVRRIQVPYPEINSNSQIYSLQSLDQNSFELIDMQDAKNRISAESIVPYPPGIPVTIKGEIISPRIIEYYLNFRNISEFKVNATDLTLNKILVVKQRILC
ncbi:MAG: hypothetical protein US28_C0019G0042 [Candidatus Daviesbacteria bacterium GW2011_GWA1_36_8]|uniref:Arginine decarboxylase n=1 Tax=Candidatus Daviesbacteria bacterium GW2011_GWA1_36_8 TaxID=1618417 RepID=A0A0G0HTF4_9BACT|nr:MAG: hypothetical protein US28_C0019G0042 [Candidatus Daviesbacteria bacterium GW2011_GWA1_36_8]